MVFIDGEGERLFTGTMLAPYNELVKKVCLEVIMKAMHMHLHYKTITIPSVLAP